MEQMVHAAGQDWRVIRPDVQSTGRSPFPFETWVLDSELPNDYTVRVP